MAEWFVAPDGAVAPGMAFANIGVSGYGHSWAKTVRWSEIQGAGGAWANRADNDNWHFLGCAKHYQIDNNAGWVPLGNTKAAMTFVAELVDGTPSIVVVKGTRDWPWPKAGQTAVYAGETFMQMGNNSNGVSFTGFHFKNMKYPVTTSNATAATDKGLIKHTDCVFTNTFGAHFLQQSRNDGRFSLALTRVRAHGIGGNAGRFWANDSGVGFTLLDCFGDAEHQNDNASFNNATPPSFVHVMDSVPGVQTVKALSSMIRVVGINFAAGLSGSGYPQGDPFICEENVGTITARDVITWGSGDRGVDLKCAGTINRMVSLGDGTAAIGHHLDTVPVSIYGLLAYAGARLTTSTSPPNCECVQSSGWTKLYQSYLICRPTAAQTALNGYGATGASIDPGKFQSSIYGGIHRGKVELTDCIEFVKTSVGAVEGLGYTTSATNGRLIPVFGLTPGTSYNFKVRAFDPTWVAGAFTSLIPYTTAASGGDMTGPVAPTGFDAVAQTGGTDFVFTWTSIAEDSGTAIQGYVILIDASDGAGFIPTVPGSSASPLRLTGFKPATSYQFKIAAYDANGNLGTPTSAITRSSAAGSVVASTPSAPLNVAVDGGFPVIHPTMVGLGKAGASPSSGFDVPASGTATGYEVVDNATGLVVARSLSVPGTGSAPTLTKTNVQLVTV